jgi:tRNA dimethylallyltransferase
MRPLIVLVGPTAVGKTELTIRLASHFSAHIISADSMQIYRGMDIGTAKPTLEERKGIPHYLIDIVEPDQTFTVVDYQEHYNKVKSGLDEEEVLPILTGGTGLYIRAVTQGFIFPDPPPDPELRASLHREAETAGKEAVYQRLLEVDPVSAKKIHPNDLKRILRALEVTLSTGKPFSQLQKARRKVLPPNIIYTGLTRDRKELYNRIDQRVEEMVKNGLLDEVSSLVRHGYGPELQSMQGLGYKELVPVIEGQSTLDGAIELIKKRTRNYAKRQGTWFRREPVENWFVLSEGKEEDCYKNILLYLEGRIRQVSNSIS